MHTDRYLVHERLGGTAARVHRAHDALLQRDVAVKWFPGADGRERWERDALLRERLGHGRAMEVLDGAPDGVGEPFVVMPLARDGSLDAATAPHDPAAAALLVARLAVGLGLLHRRGVVHGGVTPDAVLLDPALGPRWAGDGAPARADLSPEDDVAGLARIAVLAATGPHAVVPAPGADVLDAVAALVRDAGDVAARERLRAGLAVHAPSRILLRRPVPGRVRRAVIAACVGAVVLGGAFGAGAGARGGESSVAVGTVGGPAVFQPAPAAPVAPAAPEPGLAVPEPLDGSGDPAPAPSAGSAGSTESAGSAESAGSTESAGSAGSAGSGAGGGGGPSSGMRAASTGAGQHSGSDSWSEQRSSSRDDSRDNSRDEERSGGTGRDDEHATGDSKDSGDSGGSEDTRGSEHSGDSGREESDGSGHSDDSDGSESGSDSGSDSKSDSESDSDSAVGAVADLVDDVL